jgi:hypothetical protein
LHHVLIVRPNVNRIPTERLGRRSSDGNHAYRTKKQSASYVLSHVNICISGSCQEAIGILRGPFYAETTTE